MTKTTKIWIAGVSVLALLAMALPSLVVAQQGGDAEPREQKMKMHKRGGAMHDALELTDEQQTKVDAMRLEHQQAQLRLRGKISGAEAELEALLMDPEASRSAVLAAGAELQDLRSQAASQRLEHRMDFRALLTPEQRAELVKMGSHHWGRRELHRRHQMGGRHERMMRHHGNEFQWRQQGLHGGAYEIDVERTVEEGERL